jgi:hypothetical protein
MSHWPPEQAGKAAATAAEASAGQKIDRKRKAQQRCMQGIWKLRLPLLVMLATRLLLL